MFWTEAARWAVHVLNRSPNSVLKEKTPEEMWSGVKPTVDYFRVFGCVAHVHVPDQRRKKLDDKSTTCVLIGVSNESKGYRLYNPLTEKVITSRDVVFEEEKGWNWEKTTEETRNDELIWGDCECDTEQNEEELIHDLSTPLSPQVAEARHPETSQNTLHSRPRIRRPPTYLQDYMTGEEVSEEDDEEETANLVMFVSVDDPATFDEAKGDEKWIKAMETELESIERNGTWCLTEPTKRGKENWS